MTWDEHAEYGGDSTDVYGDYGSCDADGYVLSTGSWWRSICSFITYNSCDGQQAVLNDGRSAVYYYGFGTPNVGARANDNIGWFKVWDALWAHAAASPWAVSFGSAGRWSGHVAE
ncbi:hypothetical protein ACFWCA_18285 [Streptomyces phaeochromogenes]|uniref:hypothetical protein n=1 Tax=Streptomyces phaeochromogenes TaxID=1923 RepID=UPI00368895A7